MGVLALAGLFSAGIKAQVIIDNGGSGYTEPSGSWITGTSAAGKYGADYRHVSTVGTGGSPSALAEWRPSLASGGTYNVDVWYPAGSNRAGNAPFTVTHNGGGTTVRVNQAASGGTWVNLGAFDFNAGTGGYVTLGNDAESGKVVIADAVRFEPYTPPTPGPDEFRGVWVSRFEWPSTNPGTWKNNLDTIMHNAASGNYNAVVLQMRGTTETLYPSPNEPLSPLISLNAGDDPLDYAINAAHAKGLQFHCYFNTHVCTSSFASANPGWIIADSTGATQSSPVDGYYSLAPGHPEVQKYLREQVMYIVNNYPALDGIHFDRIRMPDPGYSHDTTSNARRAGRGNPHSLGFDDWTADQITRFLRDVYAEVRSVNPTLQLSAAPLGLYEPGTYPGYPSYFYYGTPRQQDAKAWLAQGCMDWIAPQVYWPDGGGDPNFSDIVPDWQNDAAGRHIYPGMSATNDPDATETAAEITAARNFGCAGTMTWSYGAANSLNFWNDLAAPGQPFENPAAAPDLPWLSNPSTAIVYGYVTEFGSGQPVGDAWVTVSGQGYTAVSAADGFWCWLKLAPGSYTFTADDPAAGTGVVSVSNLVAGEVRRVDIALGGSGNAANLEFVSPSGSAEVGETFALTVRVVDALGNPVPAGAYNVELQATGTGSIGGVTTGTTASGTFTFDVSHDTAETVALTVVDTGGTLNSTQTNIVISAPSGSGSGGGGGSGDDSGCVAGPGGYAWWLLLLGLVATAPRLRRSRAGP